MYKKEEGTGRIRLVMSKDSTCHSLTEDRFLSEAITNVHLDNITYDKRDGYYLR